MQAQAAGQTPNDLIDQRNAALDNLSQLGNTQVQNNTDGSVTVYFGGVTSTALVSDPVGIPPGGAVPPGDNFGSYSPGGATPGTGWAAAWQAQFATAAAAGTSSAALATTVGGSLGSLVGLAGYSASGFSNLGSPTFAAGVTSYATPAAPTQQGTIGTITASLDQVASDLANEVNNPTVTGTSTQLTLNAPFFTPSSGTTITAVDAVGVVEPSAGSGQRHHSTGCLVGHRCRWQHAGHHQRSGLQPRCVAAGHDRLERQRQRRRSG